MNVSFAQALLLLPIAVALHVYEEWPRFPQWARRFASASYSDRDYIATHAMAVVAAIGCALALRAFPSRPTLLVFFALVFGPGVFCNAWVHACATVLSRTYCPGLITGLTVYVPLTTLLAALGLRERLFTPRFLAISFAVAAIVHVIEVGHNVFKRW